MRLFSMPHLRGLAVLSPLILRVVVGVVMAAHGYSKLTGGPANFAQLLTQLGVPAPLTMAYVVTFVELLGGLLLIVGLLTRIASLAIAVNLVVAIALVKVNVGLIAPMGAPLPGAEVDLALIAGALVLLLEGPGVISLDRAFGIERTAEPAAPRVAASTASRPPADSRASGSSGGAPSSSG